jgi:hypothetical protein
VADRARVRLASLQGLSRLDSPPEAPSDPGISGSGISVRQLWDRDAGLFFWGDPSPDGRFLTFVNGGELAVHDFLSGENRRVTSSARGRRLAEACRFFLLSGR